VSFLAVYYMRNKDVDSHYHRRRCPKVKAWPVGTMIPGNAAQLRELGWSPCPACDPDNVAKDIAKFSAGMRSPEREPLDRKRGKKW